MISLPSSKSGATKFTITNAGNVIVGASTLASAFSAGVVPQFGILGTNASQKTFIVQGAASQTADIFDLYGNNGFGFGFDSGGNFIESGNGVYNSGNGNSATILQVEDHITNTVFDVNTLKDAVAIGGNNTSPLATLDVRGNIATTPTASISGATTFAEAVVDQSGTGDLFTASKSGATKFVIQNSGNIILGSGLSSNSFGATFASVNGPSTNPFTLYVGDYKQGGGQAQLIGNWQNSTGWGIGTATQTAGDQTLRLAATSNDNGAWSNTVPDLKFLINGPANTSAAGILDVRSSGTNLPIASFSGATTFANTVIDQSGTGDLFTASKSGATKFTIKNSGVVVIGNTTNGIAFDPTELTNPSGQIYYGTARPTRQIVSLS